MLELIIILYQSVAGILDWPHHQNDMETQPATEGG